MPKPNGWPRPAKTVKVPDHALPPAENAWKRPTVEDEPMERIVNVISGQSVHKKADACCASAMLLASRTVNRHCEADGSECASGNPEAIWNS